MKGEKICNGTSKEEKSLQKKRNEFETYLIKNKKVPDTELDKFKKYIQEKYKVPIASYWDLHKWTIENTPEYWEEIWNHFKVKCSKPYEQVYVKTGPRILDCQWFTEAAFNFAENILRYRDDSEAIAYLDEDGVFEQVTFSELFENVRAYAAAFRKHGLQKFDRVACYMSNRKEAVFAMLATVSIGAVWGGSQPYFGAKSASNIIKHLEPKFLIAVDRFLDSGKEYNLLDNLPIIVQNATTLEKVIIVPTKPETLDKDLSHIPKSCFVDSFLESGKTDKGDFPELFFEQLPFDHPVLISFTSGTTGLPKGPVHGAGCLIGYMANFSLNMNLKRGDTAYSLYPMGWTIWTFFLTTLSLGIRLFLQSGMPFRQEGFNVWDIMAENKVSYVFFVTSMVDRMEALNLKPNKNASFEHLKVVTIGGSPVKIQNYKYIQSVITDNVRIGNIYGGTELSAEVSGYDINMPTYAPELQVPALGKDIQCVDEEERPVIGRRGELVITNPGIFYPLYLWKDTNNEILNRTYLSEQHGYWRQYDECYINPVTKGIGVLGRRDDAFIQNGERFGAADIYFAIHDVEEIVDCICVSQKTAEGDERVVLFVKMKEGQQFSPEFRVKLANKIEKELWEDCVPEVILDVDDIPYNVNNKRLESVVRKIVATNTLPNVSNIRNPECLKCYLDRPELLSAHHQRETKC